jgi:hypothetical protein
MLRRGCSTGGRGCDAVHHGVSSSRGISAAMEEPSNDGLDCSPDRRTVAERETSSDVLPPGLAASGANEAAVSVRLASKDCRAAARAETEPCRCGGAACGGGGGGRISKEGLDVGRSSSSAELSSTS